MRVPESPFERYMSERILSFAYLMCPSVSGPKELKKVSAIYHILFLFISEKLQNIQFRNRIIKYGVFVQKSLSLKKKIKKYLERKNSQTNFLLFMC